MSEKEKDAKMDAQVDGMEVRSTSDDRDHRSERQDHHSCHHHSHHHHHHSHHHSKRSSDRRSKTLKQFLCNHRKQTLVVGAAMLFFVCSMAAGTFMRGVFDRPEQDTTNIGVGATANKGMIGISVSVFDQPVNLVNAAVQALCNAPIEADAEDIFDQYNGESVRLDTGTPVKLAYKISDTPSTYVVDTAVFTVSENKDMSQPIRQTVPNGRDSVEFANLKTGTDYYYQLDITFMNGVTSAVLGNFTTAPGPRVVTVNGGRNIRDVGGWSVSGDKRIKQGLLYRGGEIDGATIAQYSLTEAGKSFMLTQLNIKTDMDLRDKAETTNGSDVLGANVKHTYYGAPAYAAVLATENNAVVRSIFADLANPAQYPAYLHCTYGIDCTGTVCYLLGALLGMDQDDLLKDYRLSVMSQCRVDTELMDSFVQCVNQLPGSTLSEKVETYLLKAGVTPAQIQSIRDIFLEDAQ